MALTIACLGWSSLVWKPSHHPGGPLDAQGVRPGRVDAGGSWHSDGPSLPLELARSATSSNPEEPYPSWVITPGVPVSPSLWATLRLPDDVGTDRDRALLSAAHALAAREGADVSCIGRWPGGPPHAEAEVIAAWAAARQLDGVVWTALPPRWLGADGVPALPDVLALVRDLVAREVSAYAEEYIRRTPAEIISPYRAAIERELGWTAQ